MDEQEEALLKGVQDGACFFEHQEQKMIAIQGFSAIYRHQWPIYHSRGNAIAACHCRYRVFGWVSETFEAVGSRIHDRCLMGDEIGCQLSGGGGGAESVA